MKILNLFYLKNVMTEIQFSIFCLTIFSTIGILFSSLIRDNFAGRYIFVTIFLLLPFIKQYEEGIMAKIHNFIYCYVSHVTHLVVNLIYCPGGPYLEQEKILSL